MINESSNILSVTYSLLSSLFYVYTTRITSVSHIPNTVIHQS